MDIFDKIRESKGPLGKYYNVTQGYFMFPKLEGDLAPEMLFQGKKILNWSLNNYLGLANHPEIRKVDTLASEKFGLAYPMGARMMSGNTSEHEKLEEQLSNFVQKESVLLVNYGYQGVVSVIQALCSRKDVIVYDADCHACIVDGVQLHMGKRFVYKHNDMESLETQLKRATVVTKENKGGILVVTEGVFGMTGSRGNLKGVVDLKKKYPFRLLVDDAHGFGTMGETGFGTGEDFGVQDEIDIYFSTFAKSMASIGAFFGGEKEIIDYLRCSARSQVFAKSLPMPIVIGAQKRLSMIVNEPHHKEKLWNIVRLLQSGLRKAGFNLGITETPVTPIYLDGNLDDAIGITKDLRENHRIFCSIVAYPVVPKGVILIRLMPTAVHTEPHVQKTLSAFNAVKRVLKSGNYRHEYANYARQIKNS